MAGFTRSTLLKELVVFTSLVTIGHSFEQCDLSTYCEDGYHCCNQDHDCCADLSTSTIIGIAVGIGILISLIILIICSCVTRHQRQSAQVAPQAGSTITRVDENCPHHKHLFGQNSRGQSMDSIEETSFGRTETPTGQQQISNRQRETPTSFRQHAPYSTSLHKHPPASVFRHPQTSLFGQPHTSFSQSRSMSLFTQQATFTQSQASLFQANTPMTSHTPMTSRTPIFARAQTTQFAPTATSFTKQQPYEFNA